MAFMLDKDKLQVAALQQVDLKGGIAFAAASALDSLQRHLRPLEPGLDNGEWAFLDQVTVR